MRRYLTLTLAEGVLASGTKIILSYPDEDLLEVVLVAGKGLPSPESHNVDFGNFRKS